MLGIGFYAFTSLIFMIIVTRINGLDDAGIFSFGFSFASITQIIGTYAGRTYQVTDNDKRITDWDYLYFRIINCAVMLFVSFVYVFFKDYSIYKIIIILSLVIYKMIFSYSDTIFGIFQKNNNLHQVGISMTIRSMVSMLAFLITDLATKNLLWSVFVLMLFEFLVFLLYDCVLLRTYKIKRTKFKFSSIKILTIGGFSVFVFFLLSFVFVNIPKFAIDDILLESDQAIFGIILMPATLISICANFIIQPFIYDINRFIKQKSYSSYKNLIFKISAAVFAIGVLVVVVTYFIGIPILNLIYGIDLSDHKTSLLIIIVGAVFNGVISIIINALIAIRKNNVQVIIYLIGCIVIFGLSYYLASSIGLLGESLAYTITNILLFLLYIIAFMYYYKKLLNKSFVVNEESK